MGLLTMILLKQLQGGQGPWLKGPFQHFRKFIRYGWEGRPLTSLALIRFSQKFASKLRFFRFAWNGDLCVWAAGVKEMQRRGERDHIKEAAPPAPPPTLPLLRLAQHTSLQLAHLHTLYTMYYILYTHEFYTYINMFKSIAFEEKKMWFYVIFRSSCTLWSFLRNSQ